ncbi:MAG: hypothetical protein ACE5NA_04420 [Nitrospiraceae bacterium]
MSDIIIGIHGLANKPEEKLLGEWWEKSIKEGLRKNCNIQDLACEFKMAYWADLVYRNPLHRDPDYAFDQLYNEEPYREAGQGTLEERKTRAIDRVRSALSTAGGWIIDKIRGVAGTDPLADHVLEKVVKDLAFYYDNDRELRDRKTGERGLARDLIKNRLKKPLLELTGRSIMVIAHSMGTIIAYDVLRDIGRLNPKFQVAHFVTIGSPLGLSYVKQNVEGERKELRTPTVVSEQWVNYSCPKDLVSLDTKLSDDFRENRRGIRVEDDLVNNDYVSPEGKSNEHKSYGYLRTSEISRHIQSFLGGS